MREVLRHYGGAILAVVSGGLLLTLLYFGITAADGTTGIWHMMGAGAATTPQDLLEISQEEEDFWNRTAPHLEKEGEMQYYPDCTYDVTQLVTAVDQEQNQAAVSIKRIENQQGEDITSQVLSQQQVTFMHKGVYRLLVDCRDVQGKTARYWVYRNVNESN